MEILVVFQGHSCHETTGKFCWQFFWNYGLPQGHLLIMIVFAGK